MRINCNYDKTIPIRVGIFSAVVAAIVGAAMLIPHITNLQAVGEEDAPFYTFTQIARVFDGESWNEVVRDEEGKYTYYPAGSPDIVEFELKLLITERTQKRYITIENTLPEGMKYVAMESGKWLKINITPDVSFLFDLPFGEAVTSENRSFLVENTRPMPVDPGEEPLYFEPGYSVTLIYRAKFLRNKTDSCWSGSNNAVVTVDMFANGEDVTSIDTDFASPCTGLPPPTPDPIPTPKPEDKPAMTTPKTGALRKQNLPIE